MRKQKHQGEFQSGLAPNGLFLSGAKNLEAHWIGQILRFIQDDRCLSSSFRPFRLFRG